MFDSHPFFPIADSWKMIEQIKMYGKKLNQYAHKLFAEISLQMKSTCIIQVVSIPDRETCWMCRGHREDSESHSNCRVQIVVVESNCKAMLRMGYFVSIQVF